MLPDSWGRLPAVRWLDLSGNGLTGMLPASWQQPNQMPYLATLKLKFNKLQCALSPGGISLPADLLTKVL